LKNPSARWPGSSLLVATGNVWVFPSAKLFLSSPSSYWNTLLLLLLLLVLLVQSSSS
jgi:hypothetical protein